MHRLVGSLVLAFAVFSSSSAAQEKDRPKRAITIQTPNGWMLQIASDGSGLLQYGSSGGDGWRFKAGTFDVKKATDDLMALPHDEKGGMGTHFSYSFESQRKAPDKPGRSRNSRDEKLIPAMLKTALDACESFGRFHSMRRAELLKANPLGELPKQK